MSHYGEPRLTLPPSNVRTEARKERRRTFGNLSIKPSQETQLSRSNLVEA